jgi:hypothetical protein
MSFLEIAMPLAANRFKIFPVRPLTKVPGIEAFPKRATDDRKTIEKWNEQYPNYNVGISTTAFGANEALLVVDVDVKDGKNGNETLHQLELEGCPFPETFEQLTPTGGRHLVYRVPEPVKQGTDVLGRGLDVRSRGGYILGSGSRLEEGEYRAVPRDIVPAPEWLVARCGRAKVRDDSAQRNVIHLSGQALDRAITRAVEFLREADPSIQGSGGDENAFRVIARIKDFGVPAELVLELLAEHWNERCIPPWSDRELETKIRNAFRYGNEVPGAAAPENYFKPVEEDKFLSPIEKMNERFAYVGGRLGIVIEETTDELGGFRLNEIDVTTFHLNEVANTIADGDGKKIPVSRLWIKSPLRRSYEGIIFHPRFETTRFYNRWRGWAVKPKPGDWSKFRSHLRNVICNRDPVVYDYLYGWLARMFQRPELQGQTAIVLKGGQGTGKGTLGKFLKRIVGPHGIQIANSKHLVGAFNAHFQQAVFVFADEAFWAGDKANEGILKNLITEDHITVEEKYRNAESAKNFIHLLMASNEDWVVPAGMDDRRFCVIDVANSKKQNVAYFEEIWKEAESGGFEAALHDFLEYDLSNFNVWNVPKTNALMDQKLHGLTGTRGWWYECLSQGKILGTDFPGWPPEYPVEGFGIALTRHLKDQNVRARMPSSRTRNEALKELCPGLEQIRVRREGELIYLWRIPTLKIARKQFDEAMGHPAPWPALDEEEGDLFHD